MAGHSHWAGIKHKKDRVDKNRSKIFSKLSREITVAAKLGDKDPSINPRLRSAIQSARSANMPKENISRAIEKSEILHGVNFEFIRYEGFGPHNIAFIVEALTDNRNRSAASIRTIFQKNNGSLGTTGSASHNFNQVGIIKISNEIIEENKIFEYAIEFGASECVSEKDYYEIQCEKNSIYELKKKLENHINDFISTDIEWKPINKIKLTEQQMVDIKKLINYLEEDDDVQNVYTNLDYKV